MSAVTIPKVCKAAVVRNPGKDYTIETIEDFPVPVPGPGQLLLKLNCTGLCMSDHHFMLGDWGQGMSCEVSGHEGAGAVVALGPGVDPEVWKLGDRAGVKPIWDTCHECELCGGVGHFGTQYGKALGIRVLAIDTGEEKRKMCMELGAEAFIDFMTCPDVTEEVKKITGGGAHGVIVTGGTAAAYKTAPYFLRKCGVQVCVGLPPCPLKTYQSILRFATDSPVTSVGAAMAGMDPFLLIFLKLTITGSLVGGQTQVNEALEMAARGLIEPRITVLPFKDFPIGLATLVQSKAAGRIVIDYNL
ncbi:hypothetical protein P7C70_g1990, partial [Phenoliferia sp. Uapishka_3]